MTPEHKAKMAAGRLAAREKKISRKGVVNSVRPTGNKSVSPEMAGAVSGLAPSPASPPTIDYALLADAMLRAQARARAPAAPPIPMDLPGAGPSPQSYPPIQRDDRGMPVENANPDPLGIVAKSNNPVRRILSQLTYPPDKEQQVVTMIASNMAPSWSEWNQEITDQAHPPVGERALVEHMREYCMTLRPELPKTRLIPKYQLHTQQAAP